MIKVNAYEEFRWRGLISQASYNLPAVFASQQVTGYIGFDPSADSLHVGSLLPVLALLRLQRSGHTPIAIVGGGTGMIGDPSGKTAERKLLQREQIESNLEGIRRQLTHFLDFDSIKNRAAVINNAEWLVPSTTLEFLRDIGKHFSISSILAKESVKRRFDRYGCILQMGGSDQWGNILAGTELIRKVRSQKAYGLVFPLITTRSGVKFGKTETGTVWLDPKRTSPFRFYQFWLNTEDQDVLTYLKYFTLLSQEQIVEMQELQSQAPESRLSQKKLAQELTRMVHGESLLLKAEQATQVLFGKEFSGLGVQELLEVIS